ncbi:membrane protein [Philodulcilactobacillus myokoensis]|uniref:Membrane protein n=1 Tax=Philodulcilactobacillus myokoensis TaxID=2929573 RepID=A0A9W6B0I7_9LACO|nr:threonine/serine exporter family protein [Philodulcilactobacillus myokoensis]GLB46587.1 membrane protein [Philodulcilactobacillus myokoensis]
MMKLILNLICVYLGTIGFGIIVNVPKRSLNASGIVGSLAWLVYYLYFISFGGYVGGSLLGTFTIGVLGMVAAHREKMPVIIFNTPALVPLVPGGQAYQVMRNLAQGNNEMAKFYLLQVVFIAGAIAAGFLIAELFNQLLYKFIKRMGKIKSN